MGQIRSFVGKLSKTYTDSFSNINQVICHMKRASEAQQYMSALVSKSSRGYTLMLGVCLS